MHALPYNNNNNRVPRKCSFGLHVLSFSRLALLLSWSYGFDGWYLPGLRGVRQLPAIQRDRKAGCSLTETELYQLEEHYFVHFISIHSLVFLGVRPLYLFSVPLCHLSMWLDKNFVSWIYLFSPHPGAELHRFWPSTRPIKTCTRLDHRQLTARV